MEVTVFLKNPPALSTEWQLIIYDWNKTHIESKYYIPVANAAVFEIPPGTAFPLRVDMIVFHNTTFDYKMQSIWEVSLAAEWYVEAFIPESGSYYYYVATEQFEGIAAVTGELVIGLVWWEGKDGWSEILASNEWPPDIEIVTAWKVKNTGNEAAFFKVSFMGLTSAGVLLSPGGEATLYLYPVTPSPGSYDYTLDIIADDTVVNQYPIEVITEAIPEEFRGTIIKKELEYNESRKAIPVY